MIPEARTLVRMLPTAPDALHVLRAVAAEGPGDRCLFEMRQGGELQESVLMLSAALRIECRAGRLRVEGRGDNGRRLMPFVASVLPMLRPCTEVPGSLSSPIGVLDPFELVRVLHRELVARMPLPRESVLFPGVTSYELVDHYVPLPDAAAPDEADPVPDLLFFFADRLLFVDGRRKTSRIVVHAFGAGAEEPALAADALQALCDRAVSTPARIVPEPTVTPWEQVEVDCDDEGFAANVAALQQRLLPERLLQIVPSRTFSAPCPSPLEAYGVLRELNPGPHLFCWETAGATFFGSSPEAAIQVDGRTRRVTMTPIAGTRPRGRRADGSLDPMLDAALEQELLASAKESAEHLMLVDLSREDLLQVCDEQSFSIAGLMEVEKHSHVMHLVSRLRGTLREDCDALDALRACLNLGTVTGVPKQRAMALLRETERSRRGLYGGTVGFLRGDGSLRTALLIRTARVEGGVASVRAGAGVIVASDPRMEAEETRHKAAAVLQAIAMARATRLSRTSEERHAFE